MECDNGEAAGHVTWTCGRDNRYGYKLREHYAWQQEAVISKFACGAYEVRAQ